MDGDYIIFYGKSSGEIWVFYGLSEDRGRCRFELLDKRGRFVTGAMYRYRLSELPNLPPRMVCMFFKQLSKGKYFKHDE
jgi:hypothetical protein